MATIDQLLDKIQNSELKAKLQLEVDRLQKQKRFGLVFEDHLPEVTLLYEVEVRRGQKVTLKDAPLDKKFEVLSIQDGVATCVPLEESDEKQRNNNIEQNPSRLSSDNTNLTEIFDVNQLVPYADFGDPIYPYLQPIDKICNDPDSSLWHEIIEADNYHALQLLAYLYPGKVYCIYIDPPYNTGARDWKYNNDYVDSNDAYRHSKWLSMMRKRLLLAKKLLNLKDSVLIVTIDEKEYLHLGCLLEELFPEARIQMITSVISAKGVVRSGQFSRVEEYIFIVEFGNSKATQIEYNMLDSEIKKESNRKIEWLGFRRRAPQAKRESRPNQFYPIFVDKQNGIISSIGDVISCGIDRWTVPVPEGCVALWPLSKDGDERLWSLQQKQAKINLKKGYLRVNWNENDGTGTVYYLPEGTIHDIENGIASAMGYNEDGSIIAEYSILGTTPPKRVWNMISHNAETYGTKILNNIIGKRFDYPKSLYAVHDTLRFFVANKPNALIVDFFAGSGTTLHAVNLLNAEDGGHRKCIMVTNNEVSEAEERNLKAQGKTPIDEEWKALGIARYVTWPRTVASISGNDINGNPISGEYLTYLETEKETPRKFKKISFVKDYASLSLSEKKDLVSELTSGLIAKNKVLDDSEYIVDEDTDVSILLNDQAATEWLEEMENAVHIKNFYILTQNNKLFNRLKSDITDLLGYYKTSESKTIPMADGFKANVEFFHLGFLDKNAVALNRQFKEILPLLWLKAGGIGECPSIQLTKLPSFLVLPENKMAVLVDEYAFAGFETEMAMYNDIDTIFIITNSEPGYREMIETLKVKQTFQLYRDYLDNFRINLVK